MRTRRRLDRAGHAAVRPASGPQSPRPGGSAHAEAMDAGPATRRRGRGPRSHALLPPGPRSTPHPPPFPPRPHATRASFTSAPLRGSLPLAFFAWLLQKRGQIRSGDSASRRGEASALFSFEALAPSVFVLFPVFVARSPLNGMDLMGDNIPLHQEPL